MSDVSEEPQHPLPEEPQLSHYINSWAAQLRAAFFSGAEWKSSRPVSDAEVEAASVAIDALDWSQQEHGVTPDSGEIARAALEAAREVQG